MRLQLPLIISVDDRAVLGDDEGVGVVFADDGAQAADLVFGDEDIEDVHRLAGVFAHALVARDAAVQVNEDLVLHLGAEDLRDDRDLDVDVLHVQLIHRRGGDEREEDRIDRRRQVERSRADGVEHQIPDQIHMADGGMRAALEEHHADDVHAARRAAHPERDADAAAAENAADETFGQLIAVQNVRAREQGHKNSRRRDGQQRFEHHAMVEPFPRDA